MRFGLVLKEMLSNKEVSLIRSRTWAAPHEWPLWSWPYGFKDSSTVATDDFGHSSFCAVLFGF